MATFKPEAGGGVDDAVHLILGSDELLVSKDYHVDIAFLQVPNAFSLSIGSGASALSLMQKYPKNTPFKLKVGPVVSFMGRTDGFARASATATEISITGRDAMARLVDDHIEHDKTFNNVTFDELVRYTFTGVGLDQSLTHLSFDAAAHRSAVTGQPILTSKTVETIVKGTPGYEDKNNQVRIANMLAQMDGLPAPFPDAIATPDTVVKKDVQVITGFRADKPIQFKAGEGWYASLHKELIRGGVFLRADVDPDGVFELVFLLSAPSGAQAPLYGIVNQRGSSRTDNLVNCFQPKFKDVATERFAKYIVYGRAGGGSTSRKRIRGEFIDPEMVAAGYTKRWVKVEETVKSDKHAEYLAKKQCAEDRRKDRSFSYSVKGHTLPLLKDPTRRAVISPDTTIYLKDDEHGMEGVFWIERVSYMGSKDSGRTTEMTLMAPEDLLFGDGDFSRVVKNGKGKKSILGRKGGPI
jgi:prophage tail gpP-like protein